MKKLLALISSLAFLAACQSSSMQTYTSDHYSFEYPDNYTIELSEDNVLTVSGENKRVEIFNKEDFPIGRIHGFSSSGLDEFESDLVPKEKVNKGPFELWAFYPEGQDQEAMVIVESFEVL